MTQTIKNSTEYVVTINMGAQRVTLRPVFKSKKAAQVFAKQYNSEHVGADARAKSRNGYLK